MADDTPSRSLRAKKEVTYNEEIDDEEDAIVQAEKKAYGKSCGPMLKPPSDDDDSASDKSDNDEEDEDDYEYDDESDYEEDEHGNPVKVSRKKKKTDAEIAAEKQVALHLGLAYPKEFYRVRSDIGYMYRAVCRNGRMQGIRAAYDALIFENQCTDAEAQACISFASTISRTVEVPRQDVANAFTPYSSFNGGYYTKTSGDVGLLFGIALMAQMVHVLPTYRQQGSAQQQGFASLLANAGMHGDVLQMLAQQYTTDTPLDSAEAEAKKLAKQLNELEGPHRLQALYANLADFAKRAKTLQPPGYSPPVNTYDRSKFDNTRPKGAQDIAHKNGAAMVSLTILHRTDKSGPDGLPVDADIHTTKLGEIYGAEGMPSKADYKPFAGLRDSHELDGNPGGYVETHRAHVNLPARVTPKKIVRALRKMLFNQPPEEGEEDDEEGQDIAPVLKEFLDKACPDDHAGTAYRPSFEWGVDHNNAYLGVRYNGLDLSVGKDKPRCRSVSKQCYLHKAQMSIYKDEPQRWLWLAGFPHDYEVANLLCPPWKGYNVGTIDFYLLLSDKPPQDVLDVKEALDTPLKIAASAAAREARDKADDEWRVAAMPGKNPNGHKKRRLNQEQCIELDNLRKSIFKKTYDEYMDKPEVANSRTALKIDYPLELGVWPADHPDMAHHVSGRIKRRAEESRSREIKRAKVFKRAEANHASVVAAEPGGKDAAAAAASFAAEAGKEETE